MTGVEGHTERLGIDDRRAVGDDGLRPRRSRIAPGEIPDHKPPLRPFRASLAELNEHRVKVNNSIHGSSIEVMSCTRTLRQGPRFVTTGGARSLDETQEHHHSFGADLIGQHWAREL